jgi:hypothetical protein
MSVDLVGGLGKLLPLLAVLLLHLHALTDL